MEYHTDVVVVGAGLTAAAKVLQEGKSVIVVEKFPAVGGNTVRTGGPMNAANPNCSIGCKRISVGNVKINLVMFVRAVGINLIAPVVVYF